MMNLVKKFDDIEVGEKEWLTTRRCIFHLENHPMRIVSDGDDIKFVCEYGKDNYFRIKDGEVREVVSDTTAFWTRKVEVEEVEKYLKNLKVFNEEELKNLFESLVNKAVSEVDTPYKITYEVKPEHLGIIVNLSFEFDGVEDTYSYGYSLNWNSKGVNVKWNYYTEYKGHIYLTSKKFTEKMYHIIRLAVSRSIDKFVCNYEHIKSLRETRESIKKIGELTGLDFKKGWWNGVYTAETDGMSVIITLDLNLKRVSGIDIRFSSPVEITEVEKITKILNCLSNK